MRAAAAVGTKLLVFLVKSLHHSLLNEFEFVPFGETEGSRSVVISDLQWWQFSGIYLQFKQKSTQNWCLKFEGWLKITPCYTHTQCQDLPYIRHE